MNDSLGAYGRKMRSEEKKEIRERYKAEKEARMGRYRHGFQLAKTLEPSEWGQINFDNTVFEVKYDGELGMMIDGRIVNRSGNDVTDRFPELEVTDKAVLVGEICILGENGLAQFNKIQQRACEDKMKIRLRSIEMPATFIAFDILESKIPITFGQGTMLGDFTNRPLCLRRMTLERFLKQNPLKRTQLIEQLHPKSAEEIAAMMETMASMGGEGFMAKNQDAPYQAKRGRNWLKLKTWQDDTFEVVSHGETGVGDGYTIFVKSGEHLQEISMGDREMRTKVKVGSKVEVKFLSKGEDGALRFPSVRRLL